MVKKLIALDDGHGPETPGKRTPLFPDGTFMHENEFNRAVVLEMRTLLESRGFDVLTVACAENDTPLSARTGLANNTQYNSFGQPADLYLSVHANALKGEWGTANGVETYVHPLCTPGSETYRFGETIHKHLVRATKLRDRGLKSDNFHVLRETKMPAVLVECGFMDNREEAALLRSSEYRSACAAGLTDAICEIFGEAAAEPSDSGRERLTPIMGISTISARQMAEYALSKNPEPKLPYCTIHELAEMYADEACTEGVRHDFLWAQACKETGFFRYGGIVTPNMNNYAGIGALDNNAEGNAARFGLPRLGVRAQVQHAKAYACAEPLTLSVVDPRFHLVQRSSAKYVEHLGQKENPLGKGWATAENYGVSIVNDFMNPLAAFRIADTPEPDEPPQHQADALRGLTEEGFIVSPEYWSDLENAASKGDLLSVAYRLFVYMGLAAGGKPHE